MGDAPALRVVRSGPATPWWNMAADHALLHTGGPPTLRFYTWAPTAVSLGHFQDETAFDTAEVVVRRCTGGGAIHHDREITYALTIDAERLPAEIDAGYALVHDSIRAALARFEVRCSRVPAEVRGPGPRAARGAWCFERAAANDLVAPDGRKLCGSAQRRIRRPSPRILQHGSLPLHRPRLTPAAAAISDQVDPDGIETALCTAIATEVARALALTPCPGELTEVELAAIAAVSTAATAR